VVPSPLISQAILQMSGLSPRRTASRHIGADEWHSTIRQVPDNQEVYLDTNGFTSVMFDILERVAEPDAATDEAALKFHFEDITSGSPETTRFWTSSVVSLSKMP